METRAKVRDEKGDRLLPHPIRRQNRLTARNKNPHRDQAINRKTRKTRVKFPCRFKFCKNPSCGFWHPPVCLNCKSEKVCVHGDKCHFRHVEADGKPYKKSEKGVAKGSVAILKESIQLCCVSPDSYPRKSIPGEPGKLGSKHTVKFSKGTSHQIKIREKKCPPCALSIICKTDNFVPFVVPGLSVNSGSSSSSTTLPQESLEPDAHLASGNRAASSSSSGSERSDELATRKLGQESLSEDKKDAKDLLADLPFWLEDFTDNLEVTELPAPAHSSRDSDSEHNPKVVSKTRMHSIYTPKDRKCDVCLRTKVTKAHCRRRTGEALPRAEKFGDLITADHKVLNEGSESRDNQRHAVVVARSCHSMDSVLSVHKKQFHVRRKKAY